MSGYLALDIMSGLFFNVQGNLDIDHARRATVENVFGVKARKSTCESLQANVKSRR